MDAPITDPTLAAYHQPLSEAERIYFASIILPGGEETLRRVVELAERNPGELKIDVPSDGEQGDG